MARYADSESSAGRLPADASIEGSTSGGAPTAITAGGDSAVSAPAPVSSPRVPWDTLAMRLSPSTGKDGAPNGEKRIELGETSSADTVSGDRSDVSSVEPPAAGAGPAAGS